MRLNVNVSDIYIPQYMPKHIICSK